MTDLATIAKETSTVDEAVMKVLPFIGSILGFIPGASIAEPFLPLASAFLEAIDNGAKTVSDSKPGATPNEILQELINHVTPGLPNSPALT